MIEIGKTIRVNTAPAASSHSRVMIIYTGGTFGMIQEGDSLAPFDFQHTLDYLPVLRRLALDITAVSLLKPVDSSDITPAHWQALVQIISKHYNQQDGFVILHGTDTMAYTSSALSFMLSGLAKPVILTGAQLPISATRSDARENLVGALEIASAYEGGRPIVPEVCLYFNYELHRGCRAKKMQSLYFDTFHSSNYPLLAKVGTQIDYARNLILPASQGELTLLTRFDSHVAILKLFPGMTESYVRAMTKAKELKGLILETYGAGNAPDVGWFTMLVRAAVERGVVVVNISQCPAGHVMQGRYKVGKWLEQAGVIGGSDMTIEAGVVKLMLMLGEYGAAGAKAKMSASLVGEMEDKERKN